jgi:hypothetical protein
MNTNYSLVSSLPVNDITRHVDSYVLHLYHSVYSNINRHGNYCSGGGVSAAAKIAVYSKELKQVFTDVGESLRI